MIKTEIVIDEHKKIFNLQEEFNMVFPYLKLEFLSKIYLPSSESARNFLKPNSKTLGEYRMVKDQRIIKITPNMTVANLESDFDKIYGLAVQVFRKSGKVWLEATITDEWTLEEQNKQGEALCNRISDKKTS